MNLLVVGGSGYVGTLVLPELAHHHKLCLFDLTFPCDAIEADYIQGSVEDLEALRQAAVGKEALLYMAMGTMRADGYDRVGPAFDVNVKGVYLALMAAHQVGISHVVYTSSMSVYHGDLYRRYIASEEEPPDATHFYGFTKRLGEEACRAAAREWGLSVNALRLCLPVSDARWCEQTREGVPTIATAASDVAQALLAALEYRGDGFEAFMISGDYTQKLMNMSKARRLLHWEARARPVG